MLARTKILPFQKEKILSENKEDLVDYFKVLLGAISRMYEDIATEFIPIYEESLTWNPASIGDGASATSGDVTVPDAEVGDFVQVGPPYDLQGLHCSGYVRADDAVRIVLFNNTGGAIDLAEGIWKVKVTKRK